MRTTIGNNSITEQNIRQTFLALRPSLTYQGNTLHIDFKRNQYQVPLTRYNAGRVGYVR